MFTTIMTLRAKCGVGAIGKIDNPGALNIDFHALPTPNINTPNSDKIKLRCGFRHIPQLQPLAAAGARGVFQMRPP